MQERKHGSKRERKRTVSIKKQQAQVMIVEDR